MPTTSRPGTPPNFSPGRKRAWSKEGCDGSGVAEASVGMLVRAGPSAIADNGAEQDGQNLLPSGAGDEHDGQTSIGQPSSAPSANIDLPASEKRKP